MRSMTGSMPTHTRLFFAAMASISLSAKCSGIGLRPAGQGLCATTINMRSQPSNGRPS